MKKRILVFTRQGPEPQDRQPLLLMCPLGSLKVGLGAGVLAPPLVKGNLYY